MHRDSGRGRGSLARAGVLLMAVAAATCGCASQGIHVTSSVPIVVPGYVQRAPVEVAILPIGTAPEFSADDASILRAALYRDLLAKGYTPLTPEHVDQRLGGVLAAAGSAPPPVAAMNQALDADAYLIVSIEDNQRRVLASADEWFLDAHAALVDAQDGTSLFDHRLGVTFGLPQGTVTRLSGSEQERVLGRFADRLTGPLPARRSPPPGRSDD